MVKEGKLPYLECSSQGDSRFSAFFARTSNGLTIEEQYQAAKIFPGNRTGFSIKAAKGKKCINPDQVRELYTALWREYMELNRELYQVLVRATGLSDKFGKRGSVCQATVLWQLRNEYIAANPPNRAFQGIEIE